MRALLLGAGLLAFAGCDQVFGLSGRQDRDAATADTVMPADVSADAEIAACPSGPLVFVPTPTFLVINCKNYTTSKAAGRALVSCPSINESMLDTNDTMPAVVNLEPQEMIDEPRLSPEGDEMFVTSKGSSGIQIRLYQRFNGEWHVGSALAGLPSEPEGLLFSSPPTAKGAPRHVMLAHLIETTVYFEEWLEVSDTWEMVGTYNPASLDVATLAQPSLTPDGLRLVFSATATASGLPEIRYARRTTMDDRFDTSVKIDVGEDDVTYPHLAADCQRLYFTALGNVQYVDAPP